MAGIFEVYRHVSPSGKSYIGITGQTGSRRWNAHVAASARGSRNVFHGAIRKHGPASFTHEVLDRLSTLEGAKRAEQLWIKELGTITPHGYNVRPGGDGGCPRSPATRQRMTEAHTQRHAANPQLRERLRTQAVKPKSPTTRMRMAAAATLRFAQMPHEERSAFASRGGQALKGRPKSEATRVRMKEAQQKRAAAKKGS